MALPRYFSLGVLDDATGLYRFMELVHEDETADSHQLLIAKGDKYLSPFSKLELVDAGSGRVHIRCCYNNKFLAIRSETDHRITPVANEPVADQSAWSCTMFRVNRVQPNAILTIQVTVEHVHLGRRVVAREPDRIMTIDQTDEDIYFNFGLHDVSVYLSLRLPQYVTFKADNGNYGRILDPSAHPHVDFGTEEDITFNSNMVQEILPVEPGLLRFRSYSNKRCWRSRHGTDPVLADTVAEHTNVLPAGHDWMDGFFNIRRIGGENNEVVAISAFATWLMRDINKLGTNYNHLVPGGRSLEAPEARFVMEEAVRSRRIYNVRYNFPAARVLNGHPSSITTQTMTNESSLEQSMERTFTYSESTTTNWNVTISATYGVSATVTAKIPLVSSGSLTTSWEFSGEYQWGEDHTTSVTKEDKTPIRVPPRTRVYVSRWESQGTYDVPFTYTQEDTLVNWQRVESEKHDGLARGINNHDIFYRVVEEPITIGPPEGGPGLEPLLPAPTKSEAREYIIVPQRSRILPPS